MVSMKRLFRPASLCALCLMGLTACKDAPQQPGGTQYKTLTLAPTDRTLTRQYTGLRGHRPHDGGQQGDAL